MLSHADKINYGMTKRDPLAARQGPHYKKFEERTTSGQFGREYIRAIDYFIEKERQQALEGTGRA